MMREQHGGGDDRRDGHHGKQGRKDPAHAALVEIYDGIAVFIDLTPCDGSDQETGNHEEDVDPDKAPSHPQTDVKKYDRDNRDCPQPVDIGPIFHVSIPQVQLRDPVTHYSS